MQMYKDQFSVYERDKMMDPPSYHSASLKRVGLFSQKRHMSDYDPRYFKNRYKIHSTFRFHHLNAYVIRVHAIRRSQN